MKVYSSIKGFRHEKIKKLMAAFYELAFTSILTETYRRTGLYATHPSKVKLLPIHNYSRVPHPFYALSCESMA